MAVEPKEVREWVMFLAAIGIIIFFAVTRIPLNPYWMMLLGTMLGASVLVAGAQSIKKSDEDEDKEDRSL